MWRLAMVPILLALFFTKISGTSSEIIDRSNEGLLAIPHVEQHVKEAIFSKNQIAEVLRIAFFEATSLMVIHKILIQCRYTWYCSYIIYDALCIECVLPKGPYLPCVSMADRALLAGCPRYIYVYIYIIKQWLKAYVGTFYQSIHWQWNNYLPFSLHRPWN